MKPHEVARKINIGVSTVRAWSSQFSYYLSPSAQGGDGRYRVFVDHDVRVLAFINNMKQRGASVEDITHALDRLKAEDWRDLPMLSGALPVVDDLPAESTAITAAEQVARQMVLRENVDLRTRIDELQQRLDDKEANQEKLLRELADLRERIGANEIELKLWREGRLKPDSSSHQDEERPQGRLSWPFGKRNN